MATRSNIGIQNDDGTIIGIYVHNDGYPDHHVPILTAHYDTEDKVRALLALGDLSRLASHVGEAHDLDDYSGKFNDVCNAYGRDRGEKGTDAQTFPSEREFNLFASNMYTYLFKGGEWLARSWEDGTWITAKAMLEAEDAA